MSLTRVTRKKVPDPLQAWIDRTLASKRLRSHPPERLETVPVETVGSAYASVGILANLASTIRGYIGRAM